MANERNTNLIGVNTSTVSHSHTYAQCLCSNCGSPASINSSPIAFAAAVNQTQHPADGSEVQSLLTGEL